MGLFDRFWTKGEVEDEPQAMDFRREGRSRVATAWPPVEAKLGRAHAQVLDVSDHGFCVAMDEAQAPEHAVVEIMQGDKLIRKTYALRVWRRRTRVGYSFADGLSLDPVLERRAAEAQARRKVQEEDAKPAAERPSIRERLKL